MLTYETVIIGAGPAGLATSRELAGAGVSHVVLERGNRVGATWANLYDSLVLHTARGLSALPGLPFPPATARFPSRIDLVDYLGRYSERFKTPVTTRAEVFRLREEGGSWVAELSSGDVVHARSAVVATGIVANPVVPDIPDRSRFAGRVLHSVEYRRPDPFMGGRVLVVGAGNSAGEIAAELASAGARVTLAVRSGAAILPRELFGIPIQYFGLALDRLPRAVQRGAASLTARLSSLARGAAPLPGPPRDVACPRVPLIGLALADAIRAGRIKVTSGVSAFTAQGVRFADGAETPFDAVILATGYRAALGFLGDGIRLDACGFASRRDHVVSADRDRLYFVGHNYGIRGGLYNIARDARIAARKISAARGGTSRTPTERPQPRYGK